MMYYKIQNLAFTVWVLLLALNPQSFAASADKASSRHKDEEHASPEPTSASESLEVTSHYVHHWIPMPKFEGNSWADGHKIVAQSQAGYVTVLFFTASWCEPCQRLTPRMVEMEKKYTPLFTKFYWIFSHDTAQDAKGFAKEYKLGANGMLATQEILKTFHNPELPTIYVGDRHGWLTTRFVKADDAALDKLEEFLRYVTGV